MLCLDVLGSGSVCCVSFLDEKCIGNFTAGTNHLPSHRLSPSSTCNKRPPSHLNQDELNLGTTAPIISSQLRLFPPQFQHQASSIPAKEGKGAEKRVRGLTADVLSMYVNVRARRYFLAELKS
jgi:hypothetical protein